MKTGIALSMLLLTGCGAHIRNSAVDKAFKRPPAIKIAALPVHDVQAGIYGDLTPNLAAEFLNGGWAVVDRSVVEQILSEQKFQATGAVEKRAVEIGRLSGANFVATGIFINSPRTFLTMRMISVETGEIVATTTCQGNKLLGSCVAKELVRLVNQE